MRPKRPKRHAPPGARTRAARGSGSEGGPEMRGEPFDVGFGKAIDPGASLRPPPVSNRRQNSSAPSALPARTRTLTT
ncbi:hypothetical protein BBK_2721 [Burkholderia pseudomallei NCTC 13179]|nr:hypothetical protein BBK_2721 [Burkholderia pseudomallei NCTC 13179]